MMILIILGGAPARMWARFEMKTHPRGAARGDFAARGARERARERASERMRVRLTMMMMMCARDRG